MACCDEPGMISVEACRDLLISEVRSLDDHETVALTEAVGRALTRETIATLSVPPCDNSAMDGYAIHAADLQGDTSLKIVGKAFAGAPWDGELTPGTCIRIMTGASTPRGCAAVVMQENTTGNTSSITIEKSLKPGENIRRLGEDIQIGECLLAPGRRLSPADIGLLASQGIATLDVYRRLKVAVLSTGDELVPPGSPLAVGQIHDSNRHMLVAALRGVGFDVLDLGLVADDPVRLREALEEADARTDAVVTSGGVSVGEADYMKDIIGQMGEIRLWKVAIKPGKPFAFGQLPNSMFFGLPGNPVSALVTLYQLALPALVTAQGLTWSPPLRWRATLSAGIKKKPGRADFQRGLVQPDGRGGMQVAPVGNQGSAVLTSMSRGNCFIVLNEDTGSLEAGATVDIEPFMPPVLC